MFIDFGYLLRRTSDGDEMVTCCNEGWGESAISYLDMKDGME
jgi:hypothetical protein